MKEINFAVIGTGGRGSSLASGPITDIEGINLVAVCDLYEDKAISCADKIEEKTGKRPTVYTDYKQMLAEHKLDACFVATYWESHVELAVDLMERGIAVALEVGGAYCEADCWALVDTYEKTKTPIMIMENCCYNREEMLAYNLAKAGLLGNIVAAHGSYGHELRHEIAYGDINRHYRLRNYRDRCCENYPTHELGPIAKILNINNGNRMVSLVSMASKALSLHEYVQDKEELSYLRDVEWKQGDIVETLIKCENGELISLKLDTTLPRYYSREFTIRGTKGMYSQDINAVLIDGKFDHDIFNADGAKTYLNNAEEYADYLPDCWKNVTEEILQSGHGGMDRLEFDAFFDALRNNKPMPLDVYDTAAWMSITYLSEQSIKGGSVPVAIPDFTRGKYKNR